jgi:hypothetical protein
MDLPTTGVLFGGLVFGVIGFAAFMYGKKQARFSPMAIGVAMMVYPYFVQRGWVLWTIGAGLCAGLWVLRDW